jgi:hypothetical protein
MKLLRAIPLLLFWLSPAHGALAGDPPAFPGLKHARLYIVAKTPAGEQLGIVFKAGPQVRVDIGQFESVANLCNRCRRVLNLPGDGLEPVAGRLEEVKGH